MTTIETINTQNNPRKILENALQNYIQETELIYKETVVNNIILIKNDFMFINEQISELLTNLVNLIDEDKYFIKYYIYGTEGEKIPYYKYKNKEEIEQAFIIKEDEIDDDSYNSKPFGIVINFINYELKRYSFVVTMD